jgi:hypothetical protein
VEAFSGLFQVNGGTTASVMFTGGNFYVAKMTGTNYNQVPTLGSVQFICNFYSAQNLALYEKVDFGVDRACDNFRVTGALALWDNTDQPNVTVYRPAGMGIKSFDLITCDLGLSEFSTDLADPAITDT